MNSTFFERVQGFLNRRSVFHSVECLLKSGVTPASSSSHFSIGVTSTATLGPKLDPPSLIFQLAAPPSSTMVVGSFSTDCAKALPVQRNKAAIRMGLVAFTGICLHVAAICTILIEMGREWAGRRDKTRN